MQKGKVRALLESALNANPENEETIEDVEVALKRGEAQYWNYRQTVAVTRIEGVSLHIWLLAGSMGDVEVLINKSAEYAQRKGLAGLVIESWRKGWLRYLSKHGFYELDGWLVREV